MSVDDEWLAFLEDGIDSPILSFPSPSQNNNTLKKQLMNDDAQDTNDATNDANINDNVFESKNQNLQKLKETNNSEIECSSSSVIPSELYISTKTKIVYLNKKVDLNNIFWKIPVMSYGTRKEGVIKKQIKLQSFSKEELNKVLHFVGQHQMQDLFIEQINLHSSNAVLNNKDNFKDVRKISIGLCRKDILTQRSKKKSAFYNCFVLMLRIFYESVYRDVHVKIFNTGKMEIPGMQCDALFELVQKQIISILQNYYDEEIEFITSKCQTVLINSNFYTGYNINRDKLYNILKYQYKINATYDPCSYPGIQCKYNLSLSFMIFRTGSVLIVGKSSDEELYNVYNMLKNILIENYMVIRENSETTPVITHTINKKQIKIKKKIVYL